MEINARAICAIQFHECLIHVGYFMNIGSQAKDMSKNNSIVVITESAHLTYNFEHKCMLLAIKHIKLDATKIDTECAIFAHVTNELKLSKGFWTQHKWIQTCYIPKWILHVHVYQKWIRTHCI